MAEFVHLHVHSEYSLLDGLSSCRELAERAVELGMPALALTDHGAMYGAVQFYKDCREVGVKPIIGMETYVAPRGRQDRDVQLDRRPYHLVLLAQNDTGYHNLMRLATLAQLEGFYYRPRIDKESLAQHADGLVVLSGCGSSELSRLIRDGRLHDARQVIRWYSDLFPGRYFLELQEHDIPELAAVNRQMVAFAREFDLPLVATNDVHYARRDQAAIHDVLLCIQTGKTVNEPQRMRMDGDTYYMRSAEEMAALFPESPEALANTLRVAEMCQVGLEFGNYHLPPFDVPDGHDAQSYLRQLCEAGLQRRYPEITPQIRQRLEHELSIIHQMGFDTYFLIVWDLCRFSKENGIWWNVRGSGAASIVAYSLGITNLEPLHQDLIFERFLNLGRVSMPDIDLDYPDDQRADLIRYTVEKYGSDQVAQIITFGTMGAKASIRDVGRALDYPLTEVDRIARLVPGGPKVKLDRSLEDVPDLREEYENYEHIQRLIDTARGVEGNIRHASTHAAGVIIADQPLVIYAPLNRPTRGGGEDEIGVVTQYVMEELEELGLLKVDFLGLATLTIMRRACELIRRRHGVELDLENIPIGDESIFKILSRGDVMGLFQVEGQGMRRVLMKMQPTRFEHIIATISLYRPGPMEYIDDYIDRMHGRKPVEYRHSRLEPILEETYGVCVTGDALVTDVRTGRRLRLDECGGLDDLVVQAVDNQWRMTKGRVTRWMSNGKKPVCEVTLRNGAHIKLTYDHQVLTEEGWRAIGELSVGDYIATPSSLICQDEIYDRDRLRVLAYLIADGDLGNLAAVNFVSKDLLLLDEYERRLKAFPNLQVHRISQVRNVVRVTVSKREVTTTYHEPNSLLAWLRDLGLKHPPGHDPGGCRAAEKYVPDFVFSLSPDLVAWFLASLWDCDGYMGRKFCHYRTISRHLAEDVQALLLKLGLQSRVYVAGYTGRKGPRHSYQVTVYDAARLAKLLQPYMVSEKRLVDCTGRGRNTIARGPFIAEVEAHTNLSKRALMQKYGIDRQQFYARARLRPRISADVVVDLAEALDLPQTLRKIRLNWEEIISIEDAGVEPVYDLTIERSHNFVANGILVHNCVYQEQIIRILTDIAGYTASEADLMRRAVGKKKKKELLKHRASFIEGAMEHSGLPREAAEAIFGDIEYFARYGFNKAHGADYAVLTCQTAYLKANYPVEYMAALLTVERNNTEKVGLFIAECRRMGIEVLPPDVNCSGLDFTIEEQDGEPAIRFGLGAVKNVGEGPVETILAAREAGGSFHDLDNFCRRVDMRQVNRRALESLIKVGALRPFGTRAQLLPIVENIVGLSANLHRAKDVGQMSLFGEATGVHLAAEETLLPSLSQTPEVPQKEILTWEKDLVGVYISEHPLSQVLPRLRDVVTVHAGSLSGESNGQQVTIAGMVQRVRRHITKKGDEMAFVTLEDLQGTCDVVVFPRVWAQTKDLWQPDNILVLGGKIDAGRRDEPNLLCDWVKTPDQVPLPTEPGRPALSQEPKVPAPPPEPPVPGPRVVRVTLTRSDEAERDVQTLRQVHALLAECKGQDHFRIRVVNGAGKAQELMFPNITTCCTPELVQKLVALVGEGAVWVEEGVV